MAARTGAFNSTALAGNASAYAAFTLSGAWESPISDLNRANWCSRSSAFFTAFADGLHTFMVAADDVAQLNATYYNVRARSHPAA